MTKWMHICMHSAVRTKCPSRYVKKIKKVDGEKEEMREESGMNRRGTDEEPIIE